MDTETYPTRCGVETARAFAAVLEYLCAELIEISTMNCISGEDEGGPQVTPRNIFLAIKNDAEFKYLLRDVIIPQAGAVPHINNLLYVLDR